MTEDELAALEDRIETVSPYGEADELHSAYLEDVPLLIAAVRRLNATNARLQEVARECERRGDIIAELRTGMQEANALQNSTLRTAARLREQLVIERAKHNRAWTDECPVTPADLYPEDLAEAREELRAEGFLSPA